MPATAKSNDDAIHACTALLALVDPDRELLQGADDHALEATGMSEDARPDAKLLCDHWGLIRNASEA